MSLSSTENIPELNPENDIEPSNKDYDTVENNNMDEFSLEASCSTSALHNELLLNEAGKIIEMELERDQELLEKEKTIQVLMETVDDLKKNILHIQTEYERLDQNYQSEISYRAEVLKRTETTRGMIDSAANYSSILATSIKQLEEDKFKIAEFYNEIYQRQEQLEEKRKKIDIILKENDDLIKKNALTKEKLFEEVSSLNEKLLNSQNTLKFEMNQKLQLEQEVKKVKEEINNILSDLSAEKGNRFKFETLYSKLKRKMKRQRAELAKKMKIRSLVQKKRVKGLQSKISDLKEKADESGRTIFYQSEQIRSLTSKMKNVEESSLRVSESKTQKIDELEEKMKLCSIEKDTLFSQLRQLKDEVNEKEMKNVKLSESRENLKKDYDEIILKLNASEKEINRVITENLALKTSVEELTTDLQLLNSELTDVRAKIGSEDAEELFSKNRTLSEELERYRGIEQALRSQIDEFNTLMSRESSDKEAMILEHNRYVEKLEKEISQLKMEKKVLQENLNTTSEQFAHAKGEFELKSLKLDEETGQLANKLMRAVSDVKEMKAHLELEIRKNNELTERIRKIEISATETEGRLTAELEMEKSLNKKLEGEINEKIRAVEKLQADNMKDEKLLEIEKNKLDEAQRKIEDLERISKKFAASEETVASLRESLESSEANLEAYKVIMKKLENEAKRKMTSESETIRGLKLEISQLKQMAQRNNSTPPCTPVKDNQPVNEVCSSNARHGEEKVAKTPPTARRLLSTPVRLGSSFHSSPKFKTMTPISRKCDPYEFDSDSSIERLDTKQVMKSSRMAKESESIMRKRRK